MGNAPRDNDAPPLEGSALVDGLKATVRLLARREYPPSLPLRVANLRVMTVNSSSWHHDPL